ncbi:winged helix DNA-binding protein [Microlunatus elymi]|uniref:Winged helix DNA-binding protein n=1 Tax=Microlunatus elymi TaxID=2596828 RepID=A0A516Q390_9ACTN|nr:MarR family transcriptional regulator [Microlunatus elymi]QDP97889.1 winged helix DNA-binding protein [Microlunatus elymi]
MDRPGYELPMLLFGAFRELIDETHRRLDEAGHHDHRAVHGFVMQAVGAGATVSDVGRTLGVSKQAAAKSVDRLVGMGYLSVTADPADARRKIIKPTARGRDMLIQSARIFDEIQAEWAVRIGRRRMRQLQDDLAELAGSSALRLDGIGGLV